MNDCQQTELLESISIAIDVVDRVHNKKFNSKQGQKLIKKAYKALAEAYQLVGAEGTGE